MEIDFKRIKELIERVQTETLTEEDRNIIDLLHIFLNNYDTTNDLSKGCKVDHGT